MDTATQFVSNYQEVYSQAPQNLQTPLYLQSKAKCAKHKNDRERVMPCDETTPVNIGACAV